MTETPFIVRRHIRHPLTDLTVWFRILDGGESLVHRVAFGLHHQMSDGSGADSRPEDWVENSSVGLPERASSMGGEPVLVRVSPSSATGSSTSSCVVLLNQFLDGLRPDLFSLVLDLSGAGDFTKHVFAAARRIPYGSTVSYQELARLADHPRAVRAVASVMRRNRFPIIVPCHRVIRSDGSVGGFMGSAEGDPVDLKRKLIALERATREA